MLAMTSIDLNIVHKILQVFLHINMSANIIAMVLVTPAIYLVSH